MIHVRFLLAALLNLTWCVAYTQASQSPAREHFERELQKSRDVRWREVLIKYSFLPTGINSRNEIKKLSPAASGFTGGKYLI